MNAVSRRRLKFLRQMLGVGVAAAFRESELEQIVDRTVSEEDQRRAARGAIRLIHELVAEFARNGVRQLGDDLGTLGWWPDAARTSDFSFRLMAYIAAGELPVESIDPDAFEPGEIDFGTFDLRRFRPEDYFT